MGNFENNLREHMAQLDKKTSILMNERYNLDWGHDCDCEYCYRDEPILDETIKRSEEIDKEVKEINQFKNKLMSHVSFVEKSKK